MNSRRCIKEILYLNAIPFYDQLIKKYCEGVGSSTTTTRQRGKGGVYRTMYGKLPAGESQARRARPALRRRKMMSVDCFWSQSDS
jgi:hypothetical protein